MRIEDKFYFGMSVKAKIELVKQIASSIGVRPDAVTDDGKYVYFEYKGKERQKDVQPARAKLSSALWPYGAHGADIAVNSNIRDADNPVFSIYVSTRRITKEPKQRLTS
jgi:hypothetical protein